MHRGTYESRKLVGSECENRNEFRLLCVRTIPNRNDKVVFEITITSRRINRRYDWHGTRKIKRNFTQTTEHADANRLILLFVLINQNIIERNFHE